jgi:hypothetical protein
LQLSEHQLGQVFSQRQHQRLHPWRNPHQRLSRNLHLRLHQLCNLRLHLLRNLHR